MPVSLRIKKIRIQIKTSARLKLGYAGFVASETIPENWSRVKGIYKVLFVLVRCVAQPLHIPYRAQTITNAPSHKHRNEQSCNIKV